MKFAIIADPPNLISQPTVHYRVTVKHSQYYYTRVVKLCLLLHWWCEFVWAEGNRNRAGQKFTWAKRWAGVQKRSEREVAERARSGERRSRKWALTRSGKTARCAPLCSSALHRSNRVNAEKIATGDLYIRLFRTSTSLLSARSVSSSCVSCAESDAHSTMCLWGLHDRLQVSATAWNGTNVSVGEMPADLVGDWPSSSAFTGPWTTRRSSLQTNDCWQKSILVRWPVSMEQSSYVLERHETLTLDSLNVFLVCHVLTQRMKRITDSWFNDSALYK